MVWDSLIAGYLFLAGLGAGAFILGALASLTSKDADPAKLKLTAFIVGPAAVAIGTLLLVVDAKAGFADPMRFFLLVSNLQSVMSWGVVILCLFLVASVIDLVILIVKKTTPKALDIIGAVLAICVATYTGVLLGDAGLAFPLWNIVVLPVLFVVSALSTGFAIVTFVTHLVAEPELSAVQFLGKTELALPAIEAVLIVVLLAITATASGSQAAAGAASVAALTTGAYAPAFWIGLVVIGLAAPFILELLAKKKRRPATSEADGESIRLQGFAHWAPLAACICVLIGGFMLRYLIVMAALPVGFLW